MYIGGGEAHMQSTNNNNNNNTRQQAYIRILEQPAPKALRFRYECEGRSAGSIPGASSTPENKTFPTIKVEGYKGRAVVVVSCVTKDAPYKAHPHNLVGREGCKKGVCTLEISSESMTVQFSNLGIQCVKKRDIEQALRVREEIRVDPYRQGFNHRNQPTSIDLNAVRLCFQVFLEGDVPGKFSVSLKPVVSEPIYDKKAMSDLCIIKLSHCVSSVDGSNHDIILLCEKVAKEDIQIRFYEEKDGKTVWEGYADFQPSQVHKQHAIYFRTPRYKTLDVTVPVKVFIQLRRPSDGITSEPLPFQLLPLDSVSFSEKGKRKRPKLEDPNQILRQLQGHEHDVQFQINNQLNVVKPEPRETTSPYDGTLYGYYSPSYMQLENITPTPSPGSIHSVTCHPNIGTMMINPGSVSPLQPVQTWNIPSTSSAMTTTFNELVSIPQYVNDLLDLDAHNIDSAELNSKLDSMRNGETFPDINNLSLSDINVQVHDANFSDSLTRLTNKVFEENM